MYEKYLIKFIKIYFQNFMPKIQDRTLTINDIKKLHKKIYYFYGCYNRDINVYADINKAKDFLDILYKAKNNACLLMQDELSDNDKQFFKTITKEYIQSI